MKQISFSNIVAVAALLLCFYAFTGEKTVRNQAEEKEYCIMRVYSRIFGKNMLGINLLFSDGTFRHEPALLPDDPTGMKLAGAKMKEMVAEGWELKSNSVDAHGALAEYLFERNK